MGKVARSTARFAQVTPPFMPVFNSLSSTARFIEAAGEGAGIAGVDIIIGTTREEVNAFFCGDPTMQAPDPALIAERFAALTGKEDAIKLYRYFRPGGKPVDLLSDLTTDYMFRFPSLKLAETIAKTGASAWVYQFDWAPSDSPLKACHCLELPFVFGNPKKWIDAPMLKGAEPDIFDGISVTMRSAWISFVNTGNPTINNLWPKYHAKDRQTMRFDSVSGPVSDLAGAVWRGGFCYE